MSHIPVNHPLRPLYRTLSGLCAVYVLVFGVIGLIQASGGEAFGRDEVYALGLRTNLAFAVASVLAGAAILGALFLGRNLDAFVNLDAHLARSVCRLDDEVDSHNAAIIQELIDIMKQSPDLVEPGLSLFSATRHLERIADHATNIAEDVVYLVEGTIIRHRPLAVAVGQ